MITGHSANVKMTRRNKENPSMLMTDLLRQGLKEKVAFFTEIMATILKKLQTEIMHI